MELVGWDTPGKVVLEEGQQEKKQEEREQNEWGHQVGAITGRAGVP